MNPPAGPAFRASPAVGLRSIIYTPVNPQDVVVWGLTPTTYWGMKGAMWPFKKSRRSPKASPETLEERLDALEGSFRGLKVEWIDTYEKLYKIAGRMDAARRWGSEKQPPPATTEGAIDAQKEPGEQMQAVEQVGPRNGGPQTRRALLASLRG